MATIGGGYIGPAPFPSGTVEVDMTFAPAGASWTLSDAYGDVGSGFASTPPVEYPAGSYTLTWEDTVFTHSPPAPDGPTSLSVGGAIKFELTDEAPGTGLLPGEIKITLTASDAGDIQDVEWQLHGPGSATVVAWGTGDDLLTGMQDGNYYVTWGWTQDYWTPTGYDLATHPGPGIGGKAPGDNGPWTSDTQTLSNNGKEFEGTYTARAMPTRAQSAFCMDHGGSTYAGGLYSFSDAYKPHTGFKDSPTKTTPPLDANYWPTSLPQGPVYSTIPMNPSAKHKDQVQNYWLFWEGEGTVSCGGGNGGTGLSNYVCALGQGQTPGKMFTFGPNLTTTKDSGTTWATLTIKATGTGGNHLRNLEVVHEDYCDFGNDKSFRTVEAGGNFVTDHTKSQWAHCSTIRMLSSLEVCYLLYPPELEGTNRNTGMLYESEGREWTSTAYASGMSVGQAWQTYIDLCNSLDKDFWVCMPTFSNDTLCDQIFSAIEAPYNNGQPGGGLRDGLKVILEYSNETWNGEYSGFNYGAFWGRWHAAATTDQFGRAYSGMSIGQNPTPTQGFADVSNETGDFLTTGGNRRYLSYRTWQLVNLYKANTNLAARSHTFSERVIVTVCSHFQNNYWAKWHFREDGGSGTEIQFDGANPFSDVVDVFANAIYIYPGDFGVWGDWPPADFDAYIDTYYDAFIADINGDTLTNLNENKTMADELGIAYWTYEWGQGLIPDRAQQVEGRVNIQPEWTDYIANHPRMYEAYSEQLQNWKAAGGQLNSHLRCPGYWQNYKQPFYWGIKSGTMHPNGGSYPDVAPAYRYMAQVDYACNNHKWW